MNFCRTYLHNPFAVTPATHTSARCRKFFLLSPNLDKNYSVVIQPGVCVLAQSRHVSMQLACRESLLNMGVPCSATQCRVVTQPKVVKLLQPWLKYVFKNMSLHDLKISSGRRLTTFLIPMDFATPQKKIKYLFLEQDRVTGCIKKHKITAAQCWHRNLRGVNNNQRVWLFLETVRTTILFETSHSTRKIALYSLINSVPKASPSFLVQSLVVLGHSLCLKSAVVSREKIFFPKQRT